jgi:hypothetical protein
MASPGGGIFSAALHREPFRAFRIELTSGKFYDIWHPDFAWLTRTSVLIGAFSGKDDVPDDFTECDLLPVVSLEPLNGRAKPRRRRKSR